MACTELFVITEFACNLFQVEVRFHTIQSLKMGLEKWAENSYIYSRKYPGKKKFQKASKKTLELP
jgi:hypothetical protein